MRRMLATVLLHFILAMLQTSTTCATILYETFATRPDPAWYFLNPDSTRVSFGGGLLIHPSDVVSCNYPAAELHNVLLHELPSAAYAYTLETEIDLIASDHNTAAGVVLAQSDDYFSSLYIWQNGYTYTPPAKRLLSPLSSTYNPFYFSSYDLQCFHEQSISYLPFTTRYRIRVQKNEGGIPAMFYSSNSGATWYRFNNGMWPGGVVRSPNAIGLMAAARDHHPVFGENRVRFNYILFMSSAAVISAVTDAGNGAELIVNYSVDDDFTEVSYTLEGYESDPNGNLLSLFLTRPLTNGDNQRVVVSDLNPHHYYAFRIVTRVPGYPEPLYSEIQTGLPTIPVVLAHGIWSGPEIWTDLLVQLKADGFEYSIAVPVLNPGGVPGESDYGGNAQILAQYVDNYLTEIASSVYGKTGYRPTSNNVNIVGHSMGGLIARRYISDRGPNGAAARGKDVVKLILLGVPNGGSWAADRGCWQSLTRYQPAICELGRTAMFAFNVRYPPDPSVIYYCAAGYGGTGSGCAIDSHDLGCIRSFDSALGYFLELGGLFEECPNDGIVSVESVQGVAPGEITFRSKIEGPWCHFDYYSDATVRAWILASLAEDVGDSPSSFDSRGQSNGPENTGEDSGWRRQIERARWCQDGISDTTITLDYYGGVAAINVASDDGMDRGLSIRTPDGFLVDAPGEYAKLGVSWTADSLNDYVVMRGAQRGAWRIRSWTESLGRQCAFVDQLDSIIVESRLSSPLYTVATPLKIEVRVVEGIAPVLEALVTASLVNIDGTPIESLNLMDDGVAPDSVAQDGIYTSKTFGTGADGSVRIEGAATWTGTGAYERVRGIHASAFNGEGLVDAPRDQVPRARRLNVFPNPAIGSRILYIEYNIGDMGLTKLDVFDIKGRRVFASLCRMDERCRFEWDMRDSRGTRCEPGVYIINMSRYGRTLDSRKVVVMR